MGIIDFFGTIGNILASIVDAVFNGFSMLGNFITNFFDIVKMIFDFIPSPFKEIIEVLLAIITVIITIRVVRSLMPV